MNLAIESLSPSLHDNNVDDTQQKKKVAIHRYTAFFFWCNADIPKYSYTTSYTVIREKMTFLCLSYTNQIPSPEFTELYTAFGFFFCQIPNTYRSLWHIPGLYRSWKILICRSDDGDSHFVLKIAYFR